MINFKFLISFSAIIFSIIIVMFTALRISQPSIANTNFKKSVSANNRDELKKEYEASQSALMNMKKVDYPLPYHGILPNHPFYWIKMMRDRLILVLTYDQFKKFQTMIFYGDKRLVSGQALITNNEDQLGVSTITKAEKYLYEASKISRNLGEEDKKELVRSYLKHKEIIELLLPEVNETDRNVLLNAIDINQGILESQLRDVLTQVEEEIEASKSAAE